MLHFIKKEGTFMTINDRFLTYVQIDTQSDENNHSKPSTTKQYDLAKLLVKELKDLNIQEVKLDPYGVVYAHIPANNASKKTIGLIAHMDTAPDFTGKNVRPKIIFHYDGTPILLNKNLNLWLDPKDFETLSRQIGDDLVVTDGTTLLGADDKAGIAIIMDFVAFIMTHPEYLHCNLSIAFTNDEEIGNGADNFDYAYFNADYAYTIDGGSIHEINYENFNAANATIVVRGRSIHPGSAKNKMLNSILIAQEFHALLDQNAIPSKTEGYEGFYHLDAINGQCEKTTLHYLLRDHDLTKLEKKKQALIKAKEIINQKYQLPLIECNIIDSYYNMKDLILKQPEILEVVYAAYQKLNIDYQLIPIRGGTDGARLSYEGLLTPNLGTGGYNCHGKYEYASLTEMKQMVEILKIIFQQ